MAQSVVIKSNKHGIQLRLDANLPFEELLRDIIAKFQESEGFFKNAKVALSFEGRTLTPQEEEQIVEAIEANTKIHIICVLDNDPLREEKTKRRIEERFTEGAMTNGIFYKGTLRSGQMVESETSLVILGDVNPGAQVSARGNIVVLGSLKGKAYAGTDGNTRAYVFALDMNPVQIVIGDVIARSADGPALFGKKKRKKDATPTEPQIALISDGNIYIEPISKELLNYL